jgi:hypothetical protein
MAEETEAKSIPLVNIYYYRVKESKNDDIHSAKKETHKGILGILIHDSLHLRSSNNSAKCCNRNGEQYQETM